jgi:hypothetical protein
VTGSMVWYSSSMPRVKLGRIRVSWRLRFKGFGQL